MFHLDPADVLAETDPIRRVARQAAAMVILDDLKRVTEERKRLAQNRKNYG